MTAHRWLTATAITLILLAGGATACNLTGGTTPPQQEQEVEDCDAEDYANRETDCGFVPQVKTPTKKPAAKTTSKPRRP